MQVRDKNAGVAIVTGAAGGMGAPSAARLAEQGWPLILCDISAERLATIAAPLRNGASSIEILPKDIAAPGFPSALLALLGDRPIGAVIHTAGLSPTMGDAAQIFAVNYDATARLVETIRPRMLEGACAVLIASSSGYSSIPPEIDAMLDAIPLDGDSSSLRTVTSNPGYAYALSKRGVQRMVERQAPAFGERKARIMSISPGLIDTAMGRAEAAAHPVMQEMRNKTPLGRYGTGDEIAAVAVFLCSSEGSFLTGSDIKVDGGVLAVAAKNPAPPPTASSAVLGWMDFLDGLRDLPGRVLARLPEAQRNDPQIRQEAGRLALSAVAGATIDALAGDPDHPVFVPQINNYITIGQPNADTNYRTAKIAPGGAYRLRGRRGSMNQAVIAESGPRPKQVEGSVNLGAPRPIHDLNTLKIDAEGCYDVILSPNQPEHYSGDWWRLDPTSNMLLVRMVGSDWSKEVEPTLSIERVDVPAPRPRPVAATLEANLRSIPGAASFIAPLLVDRPQKLRAEGYVNKLKDVDMSQMGGLTGQFYYEGVYELNDNEALIVETMLPEHYSYRSLILTNDLYETTDWYNNQSSLNGAQALPDQDGVLRIVVSARDPGVPNWLDTAGYPTGVIQGRWVECSSKPVPSIRKVALADVKKSLPAEIPTVSPLEREKQIRDRRAALQQRPLW